MSAQSPLTPKEYLELERQSPVKHEYYRGTMYAMAGATPKHGLIVTNLVGELRQALKKRPCFVYSTDVRLRVSPTEFLYPDVMVVCGEPAFSDERRDTLVNPVAIIEVLSESTEKYDRGRKFGYCRTVKSLQEYVLVSQAEARIERFHRQPDNQWLLSEEAGMASTLSLNSLECRISFSEIYDKVDLAESPTS